MGQRLRAGSVLGSALLVLAFVLGGLGAPSAQAAPLDVGFRDHSYSTSVSSPTGQKPQSKLWYADGSWWGVLWNSGGKKFTIHKFNLATQDTMAWTSTGVTVDVRRNSQSDVLWDDKTKSLYVLSHLKDTDTATADLGLKFLRYSYSAGTYALQASKTVANGRVEAAVLDKDSTGTLWVTYTEPSAAGRTVKLAHSTTSDTMWTDPFTLPVAASAVSTSDDDISTLVAYGDAGSRKIGVLWSNERTSELYFASHVDGAADTAWTLTTLCSTALCPDDHLNIKSIDADASGHLYAVVKTSLNDKSVPDPNDPLIVVYRLDPAGSWSSTVAWTVRENVTRAIVLLDSENRRAHLFAAGPCCSGGTVYTKDAPFDDLSFAPGLGEVFMRSERIADGENINNVTSTKQTVNAASGLLVLAGIDKTREYVHNYRALAAVDATPPSVSGVTPADGSTDVATSTTVTASFSEAMNASTVNSATFSLRDSSGATVQGTVAYDVATRTASLIPGTVLGAGATYTATVSGGTNAVKDLAGNAMPVSVAWSFTTAPAPAPTPTPAPSGPQYLGELGRATATTTGNSLTVTTTSAVPAGARVVLAIGYSGSTGITASVRDNVGSAWTVDIRKDNGTTTGTTSAVASATVGSAGLPAGSVITATMSTNVTYRLAVAHAYDNVQGTLSTSASTGNSAAPSTSSMSASSGNLLYAVTVYNSGTAGHAAGTGLTEIAEVAAGTKSLAVDHLLVTAGGTVADSGTLTAPMLWTDSAVLLG